MDYTETCTFLGLTYRIGGRTVEGKDPTHSTEGDDDIHGDAAVDLVPCRKFLDELKKIGKFLTVRD